MQWAVGPGRSRRSRPVLWLMSPLILLAGLCLTNAPVPAQGTGQGTGTQPRTHTNDDFRVPRTLPVSPEAPTPVSTDAPASPAPAPSANLPAGETATPPDETAGEAVSTSGAASDTARETPLSELVARQDANGTWILVSRSLPPPEPGKLAPAEPLTPISTGKPELDAVIMEMATKYGVDPRLIVEVIRQESGFNPYAVSPAGAKGLMQLIDGTAARMGTRNVFDVRQNIEGGVKYLRLLLDMFNGDVSLALAGYNAGEHRVIRSGYQVPNITETRHYVKTIMARYGRSSHRVAKPKPNAAPVPDEPPPPPLRVFVQDGVVLLTNR